VASVEAAEAGGDQKTLSRPPITAAPMIGNSGAPLEHLVHPAVCKTAGLGAESASRLETYFFSQMGPRWAGSGSEPRGPQPTPWPTAAPGGAGREGGLCTALNILSLSLKIAYRLSPIRRSWSWGSGLAGVEGWNWSGLRPQTAPPARGAPRRGGYTNHNHQPSAMGGRAEHP
jgi:hypothetical protein